MKNIILHIGTPKSGTSALQNFLNSNRDILTTQNFCYPIDQDEENTEITMGNGRKLYEYAIKNDVKKARNYLMNLLSKYNEDNIILSSEGFYFYPKFIHSVIPEAKIIVYFREQSEKIVSSYGQQVKGNPSFTKTFSQYLDSILNGEEDKMYTEYFLDQWKKYYNKSNIVLRPYDFDQFRGGSIYTDFLYLINMNKLEKFTFPEKNINPGYNRDSLEYKLCLNRLLDPEKQYKNHLIRKLLQDYSEICPDKHKFSILLQYQQDKIIEYFRETNSYVSKTYLQNSNQLFTNIKPVDNKLKEYDGLSIDAIQKITRFIINQEPVLLEYIIEIITDGLYSKNKESRKAAYILLPVFSLYKIYNVINKKQ